MSEKTRTIVATVLWSVLLLAAIVTLGLAYLTSNVVLVALAAVATFAVVKTHDLVPLPKVYADRGVTNDVFLSKRQRLRNQRLREESESAE